MGKSIWLNALVIVLSSIQPSFSQHVDCKGNEEITKRLVQRHNEKRALHKAPPMSYNSTLEDHALEHAMVLAQQSKMYHAARGEGENLWASWGASRDKLPNPDEYATKGWYDEEKPCYCGYETNYPSCVYGHFTQFVWASTNQLGCGTCYNEATKFMVVVCRYYPPGNVCRAYSKNVFPPYGNGSEGILPSRSETWLWRIIVVGGFFVYKYFL